MIKYIGAHDPAVKTDDLIHRYANRAQVLCVEAALDCNFKLKKETDEGANTKTDSEPCCDNNERPA